jgi:hypothetical protein
MDAIFRAARPLARALLPVMVIAVSSFHIIPFVYMHKLWTMKISERLQKCYKTVKINEFPN